MFLAEQVIGKSEVERDAASRVGETSVSDLVASASGSLRNASAIPKKKWRSVHQSQQFHACCLKEKIVEKQEFAVVDERARNVPRRIGPKRVGDGERIRHFLSGKSGGNDKRGNAFPQRFFQGFFPCRVFAFF